jgi:hypothetical protein
MWNNGTGINDVAPNKFNVLVYRNCSFINNLFNEIKQKKRNNTILQNWASMSGAIWF